MSSEKEETSPVEPKGTLVRKDSEIEKQEESKNGTARPALSRHTTNASRTRSLGRERSNNGYGCDDLEAGSDNDATEQEENHAEPARPEKDPFEVGWDGGDNDPLCPRSMRSGRKWMIVLVTAFGSFAVTCASSIYTSTYTQMDAELGNSRIVATLGLSTFVLGIALGPFWSPLTEFYGRRIIYIVSFAVYVIWLVPAAVAKNIQTVIIARFFQGLAGSAFLSVSGGTVGDLFSPAQMQVPMTIFTISPFIGPSIGPLIGGFINSFADWRWTHYVLIIWSFAYFIGLVILVPETYHPVLLKRKAEQRRKETGDDRWHAPIEKSTKSKRQTVLLGLLRPFQLLIFEYIVLLLCLYSAVLLGLLYLFFGAFPLVFMSNHGFNLWQVGFTFMGLFVGMVLAACTSPFWAKFRLKLIAKNGGVSQPEFRLPISICGSFFVSIGLFWFAWTTYPSVHWIVPIIGSAFFGAGTLLVFTGIFTFLVEGYPQYAASALAANALVRCIFAAAFPLFGVQMYEKLGYQWATTLLAFLTVVMLPFPYLFFRFGKRIRERSRYATSA